MSVSEKAVENEMSFRMQTSSLFEARLMEGSRQTIPPKVSHEVHIAVHGRAWVDNRALLFILGYDLASMLISMFGASSRSISKCHCNYSRRLELAEIALRRGPTDTKPRGDLAR